MPSKPATPAKSSSEPAKTRAAKKPAARAKSAAQARPAPVKQTAAEPSAAKTKASAPKRARIVPPILLEGDAPATPRPSGPGQRYALGGTEPIAGEMETAELPEAYGTQRLLLVARDPHWLYAHWDMTLEQLREHNRASRDGHLIVRVFHDQPGGELVLEQHVHPESRNWFLHVGRGGVKYAAELGYHDRAGAWQVITTSGATLTPPDALSPDTTVRFETIPVEVPFAKLLELVKEAVSEHTPLIDAIHELREAGHAKLPQIARDIVAARPEPARWTPEQERALAAVINIDEVRRVWMGSLEITELIRRSLEKEIASQAAAAIARGERFGAAPPPSGVFSVSSPFGGEVRRKGFWFNVNAELIIYGATEPDATVTIGGRRIQLRRDGTFSFRFALPDGIFALPVEATAADKADSRRAELSFSRATNYRGDVGQHPQEKSLKVPRVENVA